MQPNPRSIQPEPASDAAQRVAAELGFTQVRVYPRDGGLNPLLRARWNGAPVSISVRTDIAGGICVAFYRGEVPPHTDDDGDDLPVDVWDEIADTRFADDEMGLVIAAALLKHYGSLRCHQYRDISHTDDEPDTASPPQP